MNKRLLNLLYALATVATVNAQLQDNDIINRIDLRTATLDSLIFRTHLATTAPEFMIWSADVKPDEDYATSVGDVATARIKALNVRTGLQLTGQTYYRPGGKLGNDDTDAAVSRYNGKIQAELRWYFLQSGMLKHKGLVDEINLKANVDRMQHERGRSNPELYAHREQIRITSDSILASVLLHRVENLVLLKEAYMYLLAGESVSSDNLLRVLDDLAEAERRLSTNSTSPTQAATLDAVPAGIISIDTTALLSALKDTDIELKILDLKSQLLDRQASNTTWWSDVRLAPFVRYSHYFRPMLPSSSNVDLGVSFTVPLNTEAAHQRKVLKAEKELLTHEHTALISSATDKIRQLAHEVERQNRAIAGEWERASSLRKYLRMRRDAYDARDGEYNRLSALMEYNSYLRCLENIIEMQYRRDSLLADLQAIVPVTPLIEYCTFVPLGNK